jgi:hypothetical protein
MRTTGRAVGVRVGSGVDVEIGILVRVVVFVGTEVEVGETCAPILQEVRRSKIRKKIVGVLFIQPRSLYDGNLD